MNVFILKQLRTIAIAVSFLTLLTACGDLFDDDDDNDDDNTYTFEVTMQNLTAQQPLAPFTVIAHNSDYELFTVGEPVTDGLEYLAEGGNGSFLIDEIDRLDSIYAYVNEATAPVGPGADVTVSFEVDRLEGLHLSTATMLVNTNDAISGINGTPIYNLAVGESITIRAPAYDTGTEANTETAATIPGPAGGGEGFNESRDGDTGYLSMHSGVVTADDGLDTSALSEIHRFDNPVIQLTVTRTE